MSGPHLDHVHRTAGGERRQRCRAGHAVHGILCHGGGEGEQEEAAPAQRRIDEIASQTAKEALDDDDREDRADIGDIERHGGREAERQQKPG